MLISTLSALVAEASTLCVRKILFLTRQYKFVAMIVREKKKVAFTKIHKMPIITSIALKEKLSTSRVPKTLF